MNFCGLAQARQELSAVCQEKYAELLEQDMDNAEISNLEELVCFYNSKMVEVYGDMCGEDNDMSWDEAFGNINFDDFDTIKDVLCVVLKPMYNMDDKDLSNDCANIDEDVQSVSMPISFSAEIGASESGLAVPILTALQNLETMNFGSFADAARNVMQRFGMYEMNALTGLNIANNLRDVVLSVPSGLSMRKFDFEVSFNKESFFCDNGNAKRECDSWCDWGSCGMTDEDKEKGPNCEADECADNCETKWFFWESTDGGEEKQVEFECRSCEFPDSIENGYRKDWGNGMTEAYYGCNDGFKLKDCNNRAWCDINDEGMGFTPSCEESVCPLPDKIENGYMDNSWEKSDGDCPWATYKCNDGYEIEDDNRAYCDGDNDFVNSEPVCVVACVFPQYIEDGENVANYTNDMGKWMSKYDCSGNQFPSGEMGSDGLCVREIKDGEVVVTPYTPTCEAGDMCMFPEFLDGATFDSEYTDDGNGKMFAWYYCDEGRMEGPSQASCGGENKDEVVFEGICRKDGEWCDYDYSIENGYVYMSDNGAVWFKCYDHGNYVMEGDERAQCKEGQAVYPTCTLVENDCEFSEQLENGYKHWENSYNKQQYRCNSWDGWRMPEGESGWAYCDGVDAVYPVCEEWSCGFDEEIPNGMQESTDSSGMNAWYKCNDGFRLQFANNHAKCELDQESNEVRYEYPACIAAGIACKFPDTIENGKMVESTDYIARYECDEESNMVAEKGGSAFCSDEGEVIFLPVCVPKCEYPEIENGNIQANTTQAWGTNYECDEGYYFEDHSNWLSCDQTTGEVQGKIPTCVKNNDDDNDNDNDDDNDDDNGDDNGDGEGDDTDNGDGEGDDNGDDNDDDNDDDEPAKECNFPEFIPMGYQIWSGEVEGTQYAKYMCYTPYAMVNNPVYSEWGLDMLKAFGLASCNNEDFSLVMPSCETAEDAGYCGLPEMINNGAASWMGFDGDSNILMAKYVCEEGSVMQETTMVGYGWCREDNSFEVPACLEESDYWNLEFALEGSDEAGTGYLKSRMIDAGGNP